MAYNQYIKMSDFYCTQCGGKGINIWRKRGQERPAGHLKKLFCLNCQQETNHVECKEIGRYSFKDFKIEYEYGNFSKEGLRIRTYGELKELINNGNIEKQKTLFDVRNPWSGEEHMAPES